MANALPRWFAADRVFEDQDGWYVGSPTGYRMGPYPRREIAGQRSEQLTAELRRCRSSREIVHKVREFVHAESSRTERPVRAGRVNGSDEVERPPVRAGESPRTWFRTSRFFNIGGAWFFTTRENIDVGPYDSKAAAERDVARLIEILSETSTDAEARLAIHEFNSRPVLATRR
ncbi:MAG: DUF6316 family protein [Pseudomonadota bacterium]